MIGKQEKNVVQAITLAIIYWIIFIIIPGYIMFSYRNSKIDFDLSGYIGFYILFVAPLLFVIPYGVAGKNLSTKKSKLYYVIFGLIIPFAVIYLFLYYKIRQMGGPSF